MGVRAQAAAVAVHHRPRLGLDAGGHLGGGVAELGLGQGGDRVHDPRPEPADGWVVPGQDGGVRLDGVDAAEQGSLGIGAFPVEDEVFQGRVVAGGTGHGPMPALPLPPRHHEQVTTTLAGIAALIPAWEQLARLPVRYAALYPANGAISASSTAWPQHILLADDAFATGAELREQLVHELAHQWLYLIQAIWPLDIPGAPLLTLPSGTRGRTPAEVIGAAHVAAALLRLYRTDQTGQAARRAAVLSGYGTACLDLAGAAAADLTTTGILIAQRLKEAF